MKSEYWKGRAMKGLFWLRNEFLMELMMKEGFWVEWMDKRVVLQVRRDEGRGTG
jgi:hypothetical protein